MEDTVEDVNRKIKRSFCPESVLKDNPIIDYCRSIVFPSQDMLVVERTEANGGNITYKTIGELEADFEKGALRAADLKTAVAKAINGLLQPVRDHFANDPYAKKLLETIKGWQKK